MSNHQTFKNFPVNLIIMCLALAFPAFLISCGKIESTPLGPSGAGTSPGEMQRPPLSSQHFLVWGVITSDGKGFGDVTVSSSSKSTTSDAAGHYKIYLSAGESTLDFKKEGHEDVRRQVSGSAKSDLRLDIPMVPKGAGGGSGGSGGGNSFTVTPGAYRRVQVTGPGKISFTVKGINMDLDKDAWPIVYFYDSKGYTGGKGGSGGFNGELRSYKLKFYDANGKIASESYYVQPKGTTPVWESEKARTVSLEWGPDYVQSTVDGIPFRKSAAVAGSFTLGIGYPPSVRPGWDGAVYTNITWPTGTTPSGN